MDSSNQQKQCQTHKKPYQYICLDEDCSQSFLLCQSCMDGSTHKHSKTTIEVISQVQQKLKEAFQIKDNRITPYYNKVREFYEKMRKELIELINEDQRTVESLLQKIAYHHLPIQANSHAYLEFKKQQYERIDKASIMKLITEAESGELNKNLDQQKEIMNFMDLELTKIKDKLMTVKYVLLSKKLQIQLLIPKMTQVSKVCNSDQFSRLYGLFSSRNLLIRHAKLLNRSSTTNFSHKDFFNACNNIPNCMAIVKLQNGRKVGGFSVLPMVNPIEEEEESDQLIYQVDRSYRSFIFSISNLASFDVVNNQKAIAYKKDACGPMFNVDLDLSTKNASSSLGNSYKAPHGVQGNSLQAKVVLLGIGEAPISQMQIWQLCF